MIFTAGFTSMDWSEFVLYAFSDSTPTTCVGSNIVPFNGHACGKSETLHTSGLYFMCLFTYKRQTFCMGSTNPCSWDLLNFTLTRATAWPGVQLRRHSFSPCVILHSQPPRSGHLNPGWSAHFVCWACVSSLVSRAEGPSPRARIFVSW